MSFAYLGSLGLVFWHQIVGHYGSDRRQPFFLCLPCLRDISETEKRQDAHVCSNLVPGAWFLSTTIPSNFLLDQKVLRATVYSVYNY